MKKKFLLIAFSVFFLSSCSDMRYAGMQKVKQNPSKTIVQNEKEKISSPEIQAIKPKTEDFNIQNSEVNSVVINDNFSKKLTLKIAKKVERIKQNKTENAFNNKYESPTKLSQKNTLENHQTVNQTHVEKGSWLWYIIVGLVFLLIGGIVAGTVGNILWIVGVVLLVYGLLVLLEVL